MGAGSIPPPLNLKKPLLRTDKNRTIQVDEKRSNFGTVDICLKLIERILQVTEGGLLAVPTRVVFE